jgi:hypothetical protein
VIPYLLARSTFQSRLVKKCDRPGSIPSIRVVYE